MWGEESDYENDFAADMNKNLAKACWSSFITIAIAINDDLKFLTKEMGIFGSTYSVLHIVAYSPIFKDFVSHIKCATYCVLHFFNVI